MTREEMIVVKALSSLARNADGSVNEEDLIAAVGKVAPGEAEQVIARCVEDGGTASVGLLNVKGLEPFPYEPNRLMRDGHGHIVEWQNATLKFVEYDKAITEVELRRLRGDIDQ